jgi:hypothetical protein
MAVREVVATKKNGDGEITSVCNKHEYWFTRNKSEAISDIESGLHSYYVNVDDKMIRIVVVNDPKKGKYLRTDPDKTTKNNLKTLPDC